MSSIQEIKDFLDSVLYFRGRGANHGEWHSSQSEDKEHFIDLLKPHSWKTLGKIHLWYYINEYPDDYMGHEIKIDIYLNSYCEYFTMFEGWVDNIDELKLVFKMLGIPLNLKDEQQKN